jgi:hypothetical protein
MIMNGEQVKDLEGGDHGSFQAIIVTCDWGIKENHVKLWNSQ